MNGLIKEILDELKEMRAKQYPDHIVARSVRVNNEASYLVMLADHYKYHKGKNPEIGELREAAIKTAAAAIHFIQSLNNDLNNTNDGKEKEHIKD